MLRSPFLLFLFAAALYYYRDLLINKTFYIKDLLDEYNLNRLNDPVLSKWVFIVALISCGIYFIRKLRKALFQKIIITNEDEQVGHLIPDGTSKKVVANMARMRRVIGDIPPVYPNCWYEVIPSEELPVGTVKAVSIIGKNLVAFRNNNGRACVMDAYCPHLGANLGVGGQVKGNCIECPFHGWQFDGETGECKHVPYSTKVPGFAKVKVWHSIEINGIVAVWYDAEDREPYFFPEEIPEIKSGRWSYKGRCVHYIHWHIQDMCENVADSAHFLTLHEPGLNAGSKIDFKQTQSKWLNWMFSISVKIKWEVLPEPKSHIARTTVVSNYKLFNKWTIPITIHAQLDQNGPGFLQTKLKVLGAEGILIQSLVPESPLLQRATSHLYFQWWLPAFLANQIIESIAVQSERDTVVWNHKTYKTKPLLVKEDENVLNHRRWFNQFYSENSPKLTFKNNENMEW